MSRPFQKFWEVFLADSGLTPEEWLTRPFRPAAVYHPSLDWLLVLTENCNPTTEQTENPFLELLYCEGRLVGVKILCFSQLTPDFAKRFQALLKE